MQFDKCGPPEVRGVDTDFDIYFRLTKTEADTISDPGTQAAIVTLLVTYGGPFGGIAGPLFHNYVNQIVANRGPNGCSVKLTTRNGTQMSYFIAEPI